MKIESRWARNLFLTAVLTASIPVSLGCVYTNVKHPLDTDLNNTELGDKTGRSDAYAVLGLVAWGDAGTRAAAQDGEITTIQHADQSVFSVLGLVYNHYPSIVYGD